MNYMKGVSEDTEEFDVDLLPRRKLFTDSDSDASFNDDLDPVQLSLGHSELSPVNNEVMPINDDNETRNEVNNDEAYDYPPDIDTLPNNSKSSVEEIANDDDKPLNEDNPSNENEKSDL